MKGEHRLSLNAKLLMVQLISLCLALGIFLVGIMAGSWFVEERYLSPEACYRRQLEYIRDLDSYVQANGLSSSDAEALETWARAQKYVYLALHKGEKPILETDGYETDLPEATDYANNLQAAENSAGTGELVPDEDGYYRLQFADGVFRVSVVDFSEMPYYDLVVILSLALACLALLLVNILHNRNITRSIIRLSKEVQWVAQGSRDDEIRSDRDDEIGDLARAVEQMRRSIIQRMQGEQDALAANSGLITAISHDIRTPLTALMGYLDLLEGKQYQNEEQMQRYLSASRDKARQLKELTDELFRYFLVFATPEMKLDLQHYDAVILMEQLLGVQIIRLEESGFKVRTLQLERPCTVNIDVQYLQRVLDNVFSNVNKHADKSRTVTVMTRLEEDWLKIDVVNGVPARPNPVESTKIGLQTCRKILREMGGVFETHQEDKKFLVEISLPCVQESQP